MTRTRIVGVFVISLLTIASAAQEKSTPTSKLVLSSPDAQLAAKVPEAYAANVFGCSGGNVSHPLQWSGAWNPTLPGVDSNWGRAASAAHDCGRAIGPLLSALAAHPLDSEIQSMLDRCQDPASSMPSQ